jgi:hypothetical protein
MAVDKEPGAPSKTIYLEHGSFEWLYVATNHILRHHDLSSSKDRPLVWLTEKAGTLHVVVRTASAKASDIFSTAFLWKIMGAALIGQKLWCLVSSRHA